MFNISIPFMEKCKMGVLWDYETKKQVFIEMVRELSSRSTILDVRKQLDANGSARVVFKGTEFLNKIFNMAQSHVTCNGIAIVRRKKMSEKELKYEFPDFVNEFLENPGWILKKNSKCNLAWAADYLKMQNKSQPSIKFQDDDVDAATSDTVKKQTVEERIGILEDKIAQLNQAVTSLLQKQNVAQATLPFDNVEINHLVIYSHSVANGSFKFTNVHTTEFRITKASDLVDVLNKYPAGQIVQITIALSFMSPAILAALESEIVKIQSQQKVKVIKLLGGSSRINQL